MRDAGIATLSRCYAGMNHGFLKYAGLLAEADAALADACAWLRDATGGAAACDRA